MLVPSSIALGAKLRSLLAGFGNLLKPETPVPFGRPHWLLDLPM